MPAAAPCNCAAQQSVPFLQLPEVKCHYEGNNRPGFGVEDIYSRMLCLISLLLWIVFKMNSCRIPVTSISLKSISGPPTSAQIVPISGIHACLGVCDRKVGKSHCGRDVCGRSRTEDPGAPVDLCLGPREREAAHWSYNSFQSRRRWKKQRSDARTTKGNWKWEGGTFHLLLCQRCGISGILRSSESVTAHWSIELWGYWQDSSTVMEGAGSCGPHVTSQAVSILQSTWQKGKCTAPAMWEHVSTCKGSLGIPRYKLEGETSQRGLKEEPVK